LIWNAAIEERVPEYLDRYGEIIAGGSDALPNSWRWRGGFSFSLGCIPLFDKNVYSAVIGREGENLGIGWRMFQAACREMVVLGWQCMHNGVVFLQ
jgi:hypothetical protein